MHRARLLFALIIGVAFTACRGSDAPGPSGQATAAAPAPAAASAAPPRPITKLVFQAGYKAQANLPFVAAYVAADKGFFAQEGLEVEIRHSSGGSQHLQLVAAERVQVSTTTAGEVLKARAAGLPLQAIALFGQRGDTVYAVLGDSGIASPKDFEGKTVGYKGSPGPEYLGLLKAAGVDRGKVKEVGVGFDPRILVERKVDVLPVFASNEPDTLRGLGADVKTFDPADFGVPSLGVAYVVNADWAEKNPATATAFLRATMRATAWILDNRPEALDIVMRYAPQEQRPHQQFMLDVELAAAQSDLTRAKGIGWSEERQWQALADTLIEFKAIDRPVDLNKAFTTRYLQPVYKDGKLDMTP